MHIVLLKLEQTKQQMGVIIRRECTKTVSAPTSRQRLLYIIIVYMTSTPEPLTDMRSHP